MNYLIASDEICLYWEKPELEEGRKAAYCIRVNGKEAGTTDKTHYTLNHLQAETDYDIEVVMSSEAGKMGESFWKGSLQTSKKRR